MVEIYRTKISKISGSSYQEVYKTSKSKFNIIKSKSKRLTYLRSKYFNGEKVFLDIFWTHLYQKSPRERFRRLKFYECALDLISNSRGKPDVKYDSNNSSVKLYRFRGMNKENEIFFVQIKENLKTGQKYFMSVFPQK